MNYPFQNSYPLHDITEKIARLVCSNHITEERY